RQRAQHRHHPLELPDARGRGLLRRVGQALRGAVGGARLQRALLPAGPPDARPHRQRHQRPSRPGRDQPALRRRQPVDLARRDRATGAGPGLLRPPALPGAGMVWLDLPITTHPLQAFVTEPLEAFLDKVLVSANLHVYVSQTDRGECVIGSEIDPYSSYSHRSTLPFLEATAHHALELLP